jgi:hypothetical protein
MYKVADLQINGRYFWDGYIFKDKEEIIDGLASYHDIDFTDCLEENDNRDIYEYLEQFQTVDDKLNFLLQHGQWALEETEEKNE